MVLVSPHQIWQIVSVSTLDLASLSAASLARSYRDGAITPSQAADWFLDRIETTTDRAIFITVTAERARREAAASTARYRDGRPLGPLDGVPVAWKDLFDLAGTTTTAGSDIYRNAPPARADAVVVRNLAGAGLVSLGKVNLSEFAYSGLGLNPHFGTPRNPHDAKVHRAPGGSSSGSAVAVAAGLAPVAIGTDTGGSVRIPAAFNGLVGFKTAEGSIDRTGVFALSPTLDTMGPLARTVEDCLLLYAALSGRAPIPAAPANLSDLRIVVPTNIVFDGAEDAVVANFERLIAKLSAKGARIVSADIGAFDDVVATAPHGNITAAEAYFAHRALVESADAARVDPRVVARILRGASMSAYDLLVLQTQRFALQRKLGAELDGALIAFPTVAHTAPATAPLEADPELFHAVNIKTLRNTMLGNFLNLPGFAIPSGHDANGLPTSALISAPAGSEQMLFAASLAIEHATHDGA
jgi:aspartyl-tRNA(Asn)/glutamyl-tRNA(Gln) amidotransferase subunit A